MQENKAIQLKRHKQLATSLFIAMAIIYFVCLWLGKQYNYSWIGYIKSFSEAAMVGALADWFAVTALFKYPLGLKIPHTNLIERSKNNIGENLGNFVVSNFLNEKSIRPYIEQLSISQILLKWLDKPNNQLIIAQTIKTIISDAINNVKDQAVSKFIAQKGSAWIQQVSITPYLSKAIIYIIKNKQHEGLITLIAEKLIVLIEENRESIKEKVSKESYAFIPKFVDHKLANKITDGMLRFFDEIAQDTNHKIRNELDTFLLSFANNLDSQLIIMDAIDQAKQKLINGNYLNNISEQVWIYLKNEIQQILSPNNVTFDKYCSKLLNEFRDKLQQDEAQQRKLDQWVKKTAYKLTLKHKDNVGNIISNTVGKWDGKELSNKLELEVGKDLQYIRINGTIVGGLVGLLIYIISQFILNL